MTKTNGNSKLILEKLWQLAKANSGYFKLDNDSTFMPVTIEIIEKTVISICHYSKLNDDPMRDPEVLLWRNDNGDYFPFYFRNDYAGIEDIIGETENNKLTVHDKRHQASLAEFTDILMENIGHQQFGRSMLSELNGKL